MNKSDLIKAIAEKTGGTQTECGDLLDATLGVISETLAGGDSISLIGFGTFKVTERAARDGRNPATGKPMKIKASKSPSFKAGKSLKDAVNT
jgi:DNA-binding protein HU-beta